MNPSPEARAGDAARGGPAHGVVVVVRRGGRLLMIRRSAKVVAPGAWCFVGGAIQPGETQPDAVVREFREEVGGSVRPVRKVWEYARADGGLVLHFWLAELDGPPGAESAAAALSPDPAEVADLRWCTMDEATGLPGLLPSNREFLARFGGRLSGEAASG